MKIKLNFIPENIAPLGAKRVVLYDKNEKKVGSISLGKLSSNTLGEKMYTFGALSDVHLNFDTAKADFQKALGYINDVEKVDFICLCGDMGGNTSNNAINFDVYKEYIDNYSPNVPVHLATGNHDVELKTLAYEDTIPYTGNPLYYSFTQDNDIFIMVGMRSWTSTPFSTAELQWLYETLEANRNKRCFVFQHTLRVDGCGNAHGLYPRDDLNNTQGKVFKSLMEHYKNVVWFHGHSHTMFELQNNFPIANYDRLFGCHSVHIPSIAIPKDSNHNVIYEGSQGYIVDVYENGIHLRGRDFITEEFVPVASYWIDTTPIAIPANSYVDSTGTINL